MLLAVALAYFVSF